MKNKIVMSIVGGISATIVMTLIMILGASMGMPKMEPWQMLADKMGTSIAVGWVMHFMIGIIFALSYAYIFMGKLKGISQGWARGAVFGIIAFVIAQIAMMVMGNAMPDEGMIPMIMAGLMGHVIFGAVVGLIVK